MLDKQLKRSFFIFILVFALIFGLDQWIKYLILEGMRWNSEAVSIVLVYNFGVAFSMLSFLGDWLKYFQVLLVVFILFLLVRQKEFFTQNNYVFGIIFGAGCSNIFDRFIHGGVVDYVYWHYGFEFAVFNFADAMIDVGVGILILKMLLSKTK